MLSISILLLGVSAAAGGTGAQEFRATTGKSLDAFGSCFSRHQDAASRPWAFVPNEKGGTFTNAGASGISTFYRLMMREASPRSRLELVADTAERPALMEAINQCR